MYTYTYIYKNKHLYIDIHKRTHVYISSYIYAYICIHIHILSYTFTHVTYSYITTSTPTYIHTYIHPKPTKIHIGLHLCLEKQRKNSVVGPDDVSADQRGRISAGCCQCFEWLRPRLRFFSQYCIYICMYMHIFDRYVHLYLTDPFSWVLLMIWVATAPTAVLF